MSRIDTISAKFNLLSHGGRAFIASVVLLGVLLVASSIIVWRAHEEQSRQMQITAHTMATVDTIDRIRIGMLEAIRGERGYMLTGDPAYLEPFETGRTQMRQSIAKLAATTDTRAAHPAGILEVERVSQAYLEHLSDMIELRRTGRLHDVTSIKLSSVARDQIVRMDTLLSAIDDSERSNLDLSFRQGRFVLDIARWAMAIMSLAGFLLIVLAGITLDALRRSQHRERQSREELRLLAQTDDLTGLANRREFLSALNRQIALARRQDTTLTLAIFDIDHFKLVNDMHGHTAGDDVLRRIAKIAASTVRGSDLVGRIGGEEFGILLPGTTLEKASSLCERLRHEVRRKSIATARDAVLPVTISIGLAEMAPLDDPARLIERADTALYQAKNGGRDRLCLAA